MMARKFWANWPIDVIGDDILYHGERVAVILFPEGTIKSSLVDLLRGEIPDDMLADIRVEFWEDDGKDDDILRAR